MTLQLKHRGPDALGIFEEYPVGLGHTRLSILDLSERGNQPMHSHSGRYVMSYNGEIYNYREIANELMLLKRHEYSSGFRSSSDSEVILEAFANWGVSFVEKLNGMFAIAIYDRETKELFLFRDRMGIKPLYYASINGRFLFASELKSVLASSHVPGELCDHAITQFLSLGFIPAPHTIYKHVNKLEPGTYLRVGMDGMHLQKYWSVTSMISEDVITSEKEALIKLSDLLMSSVQYQLKSDVPFGVFLSGGIDSSLITAQAVALSSTAVNTFSIGFRENRYNESFYAARVAKALGTNHHEFTVSYKDAMELADQLPLIYDEPFGDSSAIPTLLVSALAKKHVTVTLSGEGGDELFLGYGSYVWARRLKHPIARHLHNPIRYLLENSGKGRFQRAASLFDFTGDPPFDMHVFSQEQYLFSLNELSKLLVKYSPSAAITAVNGKFARKLNSMEKQALFDMRFYLPGDLLTKVDRASMFHSLETRVPYLDHRIVELALNISPQLKYRNGVSKYLLKQILYQYLPKDLFNRPKQGFAIPLEKWLCNELSYLIDEYLSEQVVSKYNVVQYGSVKQLLEEFRSGRKYLYNRVWHLLVLHQWLVRNVG